MTVLVVPTNEELAIAQAAWAFVCRPPRSCCRAILMRTALQRRGWILLGRNASHRVLGAPVVEVSTATPPYRQHHPHAAGTKTTFPWLQSLHHTRRFRGLG
jgi:hypothetical protein